LRKQTEAKPVASWKQENVSKSSQTHCCFSEANFAIRKHTFPSLGTEKQLEKNDVTLATFLAGLARP